MKLKINSILIVSLYVISVIISFFNWRLFGDKVQYLNTTLLYIRIVNIVLSVLILGFIFIIYKKYKNSSIFMLGLIFLIISFDIIYWNIDYCVFNNEKFFFSNYLNIFTLLLRVVILIISLYPNSKIHKFIYRNGEKSIIFIIFYIFICVILRDIFKKDLIIDNSYFFVTYNLILISIYLFSSVKLWKLAKTNSFIFKYFSISILVLALKAMCAIYGFFHINFYIKLISISMTFIFFLIVIVGFSVKMIKVIDDFDLVVTELMRFFNFVENNNYSNMFICDYDMDIKYVNKKIKEYYNFEDPLKNLKKDLLNNEHLCFKLRTIINELDSTGTWSGIIEDNSTNEILECYIQKLDIDSSTSQILVSYVDIRDKIDLQKNLDDIKIREVKKARFISNISHEFKTPLNVIYCNLQLLENYSNNNEVDFRQIFLKHSNSLKLNCRRMTRLVNNILDKTKLDLGTLKPNYNNYNIVLLTEDIVDSVVEFSVFKDLIIEFDTNSEEHYIMCDPFIIEKILLNIMSNAIKYSDRGSVISVSLMVEEKVVKIAIKDRGCGIDLNNNLDIFDKFTRGDESFTRLNEGSGIGLSIVKSMVELIDGKITVESKVGEGSVFEIFLPNKLMKFKDKLNYKYEGFYNTAVELSDIYEIN